MRRLQDALIYPTFMIALMLVATTLPSMLGRMSCSYAPFGEMDNADQPARIVVRGSLIGLALDDSAPARIRTLTQMDMAPTNTAGLVPKDTAGPTNRAISGIPESLAGTPEMSMATVSWVTWTATVAGTATTTASSTTKVLSTLPRVPSRLLDRLADDKPSIWGSKGFYVLLGLVYVTLLGLFIKQVISISGGGHEQR